LRFCPGLRWRPCLESSLKSRRGVRPGSCRPDRGARGLGQRRQHEAVPGGQDFVVGRRAGALCPGREQPGVAAGQQGGNRFRVEAEAVGESSVVKDALQHHAAFPIAVFSHAVSGLEKGAVLRQLRSDLFPGPEVEFPLHALRISVQCGAKAAFGMGQLAGDKTDRSGHHAVKVRLAGDLPGVQIDARQLGVIVKHLFEMRHAPVGIGGVAGKAAAHHIVHTAARHAVQRVEGRFERIAVDFDADKMRVEKSRGISVLERFVRHDVTPVAGRITDAEEDGLLFASGLVDRLRPPGEPVHRVAGVLEQVGRGLVTEQIGHIRPCWMNDCPIPAGSGAQGKITEIH